MHLSTPSTFAHKVEDNPENSHFILNEIGLIIFLYFCQHSQSFSTIFVKKKKEKKVFVPLIYWWAIYLDNNTKKKFHRVSYADSIGK